MNDTPENEDQSNVLTLRKRRVTDYIDENEILFPASRNFSDDPLSELLNEFNELTSESEPIVQAEDFIFHHQKPWDYQVKYSDDLRFMGDRVLEQIERLKIDTQRIRYYLDEMNIDQ